jgi:hypothetical protein
MKTKIFRIRSGYETIATFNNIDAATDFFALLVKNPGQTLHSVSSESKEGESRKYAHYWGEDKKLSIEIYEVEIYPSKKDAEFAVFNSKGDEEDQSE